MGNHEKVGRGRGTVFQELFQIASQKNRCLHVEIRMFRQGCRRNRKPPPLQRGGRSPQAIRGRRNLPQTSLRSASPLLVEGAFERSHVSPGHDSAITLSYKTGAGCSKRSRAAHFCLLGQGLPERQTVFAGWCPVLKIEYAAFVANARPGFITGHAFLFS